MARPFIKWAGGKTQLLPELLPKIPRVPSTIFEPFVGGGSVYFSLAEWGGYKRAVINDVNPELTNLYRMVRDNTGELIDALNMIMFDPRWNTEDFFKFMRASEPEEEVWRAARMIYLNKTAFNGLHRVNKDGKFNVPFGRYKNPRLYDLDNLWACRRALAGVEIRTGDFETALEDAVAGDVVYLDPPYVPLSSTSSFTAYAGTFGPQEQQRLARLFRTLVERGVYCVASNSDSQIVRDLYPGFELHEVEARRSVNADASKRGKITELIVVGEPANWSDQRQNRQGSL